MRIAIDGTCASGKSTIAKRLANELGISFFSAGLVYRAITLLFLRNGIGLLYKTAMQECLKENIIVVKFLDNQQFVYINGQDVTSNLASSLVNSNVAKFAEILEVREYVRVMQKNFAFENDVIMEGRDIGTEILPSADFKFFINADYYVRVDRRIQQLISKGETVDEGEVFEWLNKRDMTDMSRQLSPLKIERDYKYIDTSDMSVDESVKAMLSIIQKEAS